MMRLMLWTAEFVCRVANTRWPVSAIVSAASIVSRSRISPMSTTSGSWRRTYFSASLKVIVSAPTSRWFTMQRLCGWRYSIGSSTVMMWSRSSVLILSMIEARVVLLPEPVGPVTSTRPRGRVASSATTGGSPSSSKVRILNGIERNAPDTAPRWTKMLARNRAKDLTPKERSSSLRFSNSIFCSSVRTE